MEDVHADLRLTTQSSALNPLEGRVSSQQKQWVIGRSYLKDISFPQLPQQERFGCRTFMTFPVGLRLGCFSRPRFFRVLSFTLGL